MKTLLMLLTLLFSQASLADMGKIAEACEKSQNIDFCEQYKVTKKILETRTLNFVKNLGLEKPLAVGAFVARPAIKFNVGNHKFSITSNNASYSLDF